MIAQDKTSIDAQINSLLLTILDTVGALKHNAALLEAYQRDRCEDKMQYLTTATQLEFDSESLIDIYINRRDVLTDAIEQNLGELQALLRLKGKPCYQLLAEMKANRLVE